jgi:hypothetical protein
MAIKTPTQWIPTSGQGYLVNVGVTNITDQQGNNITDQLGNPITDSGYQYEPKYPTTWTQAG